MKKSNLLLSLTFVPTVTALAISCSSNSDSNIPKTPTNVKSQILASDLNLSNELSSAVYNMLNENFIFEKKSIFLIGDYELSSFSQITINNKTISDDKTSISVSFQLAPGSWYDANGKLAETQSSNFLIKISGFKVPTTGKTPTSIKENLYASDFGFSNKLASEVINTIDDQFIYSKRASILLGDYELNAANQITSISKVTNKDQTSISLTFTLPSNTWYDENGELGVKNKEFTTIIKGFKSPLKTPTLSNSSISLSVFGWTPETKIEEANKLLDLNFIFDNRSIFLTGDYDLITTSQIISISKTIEDNQTSISVTFGLASGTWYDENGKLGTTNKNFTSKIVGFKPSSVNTLYFKEQNTFNWGDSTINTLDASVTTDYLKSKLIQNRNDLLNIPNNTKYNEEFFRQNLTITNYEKNNLSGFITLSIQINDDNSQLTENICIKGFKPFDEKTIVFPTLSSSTSPTEDDLNKVVQFWKDMPLGINKYYFTQSELNDMDDYLLFDSLIDLRTNKVPLPLTTEVESPFYYECVGTTVDTTNHLIKSKLYIYNQYNTDGTPFTFIDVQFPYKLFESTQTTRKDIVNKISKAIKITPKNDSYKNMKAKLFTRLTESEKQSYFELNINEIYDLFWIDPEYGNVTKTFTCPERLYNFKNPTELNFEIHIDYNGHPEISANKIQTISGFKDVETIGTLDKEPIVNLKTPQGAVSYKGQLEKFYFDEFITTTRVNYDDYLKDLSYDDVKKEIMYHIRFYLYQMFSDNYSEINYYIQNDNLQNHTFTAIGEGIIKEDRNNVYYGFQPQIFTEGSHNTKSVKKGDKIKILLEFNSNGYDWKPISLERGVGNLGDVAGFYAWYWDYSDKCSPILNTTSPYFKDDIPRSRFSIKSWNVYINGQPTLSNIYRSINYGAPIFSQSFTIPKSNK